MRLEFLQEVQLERGALDQLLPSAISFDAIGGEICVTEQRGRRLHLLNEAGVEHFCTLRLSDLRAPQDGCIAGDGSLFCLDLNQDGRGLRIRKLNLLGEAAEFEAEVPAAGWSPNHLTLGPQGRLVSLDTARGILACHDAASGALLWQALLFDGDVFELGMGRPYCEADGRILVPGGETHMVHVYDRDGREIGSFGEFGTGPGGLVFPIGVARAGADRILVLDRMRHKILVYDDELEYVTELGQGGIWPGLFYHPLAIAVVGTDRVIVSQGYQSRVQIFALTCEGQSR